MLSKRFLGVVTSLFLLAGVGGTSTAKLSNNFALDGVSSINSIGGPTDLSVANEDKVIQMLKNEGKIPKDASYQDAQKIYLQFMQDSAKANQKLPQSKLDRDLKAKQNQAVQKYKFDQSKPDTNPKKVNVLVLLVDFKDFKHNSIKPGETDMYYTDYSQQHYEDMLFSDNGYKGPNGETLLSAKQYYAQQSGGSLEFDGKVSKWLTVPGNAADYGKHVGGSNDTNPRQLIKDALKAAAQDGSINLTDFDNEDLYDLDGDGVIHEQDGIIDYLMVIHAGIGEEAGGGSLGSNAIWSHSWDLGGVYKIPGTTSSTPYWGGKLGAYHYTVEPEDGATGVFAHEFGHNLGLPDEYDTQYSSASGEPISYWSIMSSGSWTGKIAGTEPSGFSPYDKQMFQALYGGNWQKQVTLDFDKLTNAGARVDLRQADEQGQVVRINLPDRVHTLVTPTSGKYAYWGGKGEDGTPILTNMTTSVDLSNKTAATLKFKTSYDIENGWDYASVQVREAGTTSWNYIKGNITTTEGNPDREVIVPNGITGTSDGWVDASFDLSAYAGKKIDLKLEYQTDSYTFGSGFYVDDIQVVADNNVVLSDNAEGTSAFTLNGFAKNTGSVTAPNYYLIEWRNQHGVDTGLAHISTLGRTFAYDPGMVVWYADNYYTDNWTGVHPGEGYLGIVDADQNNLYWAWTDPTKAPLVASGKYQMHDAAFSKNKDSAINLDLNSIYGRTLTDTNCFTEPSFDDTKNYLNPGLSSLGRNIPHLGLKIQISNQASDNSSASLVIKK